MKYWSDWLWIILETDKYRKGVATVPAWETLKCAY